MIDSTCKKENNNSQFANKKHVIGVWNEKSRCFAAGEAVKHTVLSV